MLLVDAVKELGATIPQQGIARAATTQSGFLKGLQFFEGNGTLSHDWVQEDPNARAKAGPVPINGTVPQTRIGTVPKSTAIKWFGDDVPFDRRNMRVHSNIQNAKAAFAELQVETLVELIEEYLITGDNSSDPNVFDGLQTIIGAGHAQTRKGNDGAGGDILWKDIDLAWARLHPRAKKNAIWMGNSTIEAEVRNLIRTNADPQEMMDDDFGGPFLRLRGRPFIVNDFIPQTEAGASTSIYVMGIGEQGVHGRLPLGGQEMITIEDLGRVPGYVADVIRVLFGMCLVVKSELWVARISEAK